MMAVKIIDRSLTIKSIHQEEVSIIHLKHFYNVLKTINLIFNFKISQIFTQQKEPYSKQKNLQKKKQTQKVLKSKIFRLLIQQDKVPSLETHFPLILIRKSKKIIPYWFLANNKIIIMILNFTNKVTMNFRII